MNIEEAINHYLELKPCKKWIESIEPKFFFEFAETIITAYEKEKEKNKKIEKELEKHIKFCEQEAEGSLNNEICHITLKFNKGLLDIINEEE